jgi:Carboxypeptidase regulatory-like domain
MRKLIGWSVLNCLYVLLLGNAMWAQGVGSSGNISGTVTDASGAAVPNVNVTIVDRQTGFQRSVTTDSSGRFQFVGLSPAGYELQHHCR